MSSNERFVQGRFVFEPGYGAVAQAPDGIHTKIGDGNWAEHAAQIAAAPHAIETVNTILNAFPDETIQYGQRLKKRQVELLNAAILFAKQTEVALNK